MKKVLDSWAMLAWLQEESPACNQVQDLLDIASSGETALLMNLINVGEVYYRLIRTKGDHAAQLFWYKLKNMPIRLIRANESIILTAARLKGKYPISYADSFAVATAIAHECQLVTGDPEFMAVNSLIEIEWLERKPS